MNKPFSDYVWSYSSATSCSLQLLWRRRNVSPSVKRADAEESEIRRNMGSAMHDFARLAMMTILKKGAMPRPDKVAWAVIRSGGGKEKHDDPMSFMRGPGYRNLVDRAGDIIDKGALFIDRFKFNADDMIGVEKPFGVDLAGNPYGYNLTPPGGVRGRIDWVELSSPGGGTAGQLRVIDFKNRPAMFSDGELKSNEQLSTYLWAMASHYPRARDSMPTQGIYYFQLGTQREVSIPWETVDKNFKMVTERIKLKKNMLEKEILPEPGSGKCQYCEYIVDCPEGKSLMESEGGYPSNPSAAKKLASGLFVLSEVTKAAESGLKDYCRENGPVQIDNGTVYGYTLKHSDVADVEKVISASSKFGLDLKDVLSVNMRAVKSLMKKNEDFANEIEKTGAISKSQSTVFDVVNPNKNSILTSEEIPKRKKSKVVLKR